MIETDRFAIIMNPKAASSSIAGILKMQGLVPQGQRHEVRPSDAPIRAAVYRDPQDRLLSGWRQWGDGVPFDEWVSNGIPKWVADGVDFKTTPQEYWLDSATHVLRFSHLADDWGKFCPLIGAMSELPHINRSVRC